MNLKKGDVVTIRKPGSVMDGKTGRIVEIIEGNVFVYSGKIYGSIAFKFYEVEKDEEKDSES